MKQLLMAVLAVLMFIPAVHADGTQVDVSAITCFTCLIGDPPPPFVDLEAQFTVVEEFSNGQFYSPWEQQNVIGGVDAITGVTGTINGVPITGFGVGSWLEVGSLYFPGTLELFAGPNSYGFFDDQSGYIQGTAPTNWDATLVPEPGTWLLLTLGISLMGFLYWRRPRLA